MNVFVLKVKAASFLPSGREDDYKDTSETNPRKLTTLAATTINQEGFPSGTDTKLKFEMKNRDEVPSAIKIRVSRVIFFLYF